MIVVEVFVNDAIIWAGSLHALPSLGSVIAMSRAAEKASFYRVLSQVWSVGEGNAVSMIPPRLDVVEIDPNTGKPKESLIKTVNLQ